MRSITRYVLPALLAFLIIAGSCSSRKSKAEHKDIIPEKDLILILTDVHIADGLLGIPNINFRYSQGDTLSVYIDIIEKHGYTKPQMDRTLRYYFIKKPKKLLKIYDKVLGALSEIESRGDKDYTKFFSEGQNRWPGEPFYSYPDPSGKDPAWFDFSVGHVLSYRLKFTMTMYPDDQSVNPYLGFYFSHPDTAGNETKTTIPSLPYIKDGLPHNYDILVRIKLPPPVRLKGWFINQEEMSSSSEKHFRIDRISLSQ
jgi:hypothetical protein